MVIRPRWTDGDPGEASAPLDWRMAAAIVATLFLNVEFCARYGLRLTGSGSLAADIGWMAVTALLITALFFLGPALAAQSCPGGLRELLERTFGAIPGLALRICLAVFLSLWIGRLIVVTALWALAYLPGHERPLWQTIVIAAGIAVFSPGSG